MAVRKYTKTHEWVAVEADTATVGISDYAQKELGDIVFIELPKVGSQITKTTTCATIESTKAASELYAPCTGEVIEVNIELERSPQLVNESPYDEGWIFKVKLQKPEELNQLLDEASYQEFIAQEKQ